MHMDPLTDPSAVGGPAGARAEPVSPDPTVMSDQPGSVIDAPSVPTTGLVPLHPAAVIIWRITGAAWAVVVGAIAITVGAVAGSGVAATIAAVATGILLVLAWLLPARRYRRWRYAIGEDALEIHRGVWTRTSSAVPFHRIQQIDVAQGPLQRRHGVVTLQLRTAAAASDGTVPHLDADDASVLRAGLLRVAARSAADDGH